MKDFFLPLLIDLTLILNPTLNDTCNFAWVGSSVVSLSTCIVKWDIRQSPAAWLAVLRADQENFHLSNRILQCLHFHTRVWQGLHLWKSKSVLKCWVQLSPKRPCESICRKNRSSCVTYINRVFEKVNFDFSDAIKKKNTLSLCFKLGVSFISTAWCEPCR